MALPVHAGIRLQIARVFRGSLLLAVASFASSQTLVPPHLSTGYRLVFQDEFDTLDLSPDGSGKHAWYVNVWFNHKRRPIENVSVSGSVLSLLWRDGQESNNTSITTASPDGRYSHSWKFGYFEARMKWKPVNGAWPAFWLIPVEDATSTDFYTGKRESGELDVFEGQGDHPTTFYGTIHHWFDAKDIENNGRRNASGLPAGTDFSQYHTYGVLWEPEQVTWFFDNKRIKSEKTYSIFARQNYFLVLTMQEGAQWKEGNKTGVSVNEMGLDVDWVRVWQR